MGRREREAAEAEAAASETSTLTEFPGAEAPSEVATVKERKVPVAFSVRQALKRATAAIDRCASPAERGRVVRALREIYDGQTSIPGA